jgi:phenylalanyl-tRNA synthetase beta chain
MKISLAWMNKYLSSAIDADEADRVLTSVGFPIDARDAVAGESGAAADVAMEVEVTSNRSDCLSHIGVAREVAAATGRKLLLPSIALPERVGPAAATLTSVEVRVDACPVYTARVIQNVKVGPSPAWLVRALTAVGQRSVNNVVDITNFVLLELGQPLHAFDLSKLRGKKIIVRGAMQGENFVAIDSTKHTLTPQNMVIADDTSPVAIAGVMGGLQSEVSFATTDVLLEAALFDAMSVRRTSRALKLASDSSYRFERGLDPAGVERASVRAAQLIAELTGGIVAQGVIRVGATVPAPLKITLRVARCEQVLSLSLGGPAIVTLLDRLGLSPTLDANADKGTGLITCMIPTHRLDLSREIDLIEEVGRLHGLDHVAVRESMPIVVRPPQPAIIARKLVAQNLVAHGFHETITHSFLSKQHGEPFLPKGASPLLIQDDRRKAEPLLRPSLLPSLLRCVKSNHDVGNTGVKLFEVASVWWRLESKIVERRVLTLVAEIAGKQDEALREMRGAIDELFSALAGDTPTSFAPTSHGLFTAAARVSLGAGDGQELGVMGILAPAALKALEVRGGVVAAELLLSPLIERYPPQRLAGALPRFPGIERDLSVVVDEAVTWATIQNHVTATTPALMEELRFLGTYRGKPIAAGRKSVSFRMIFRDESATLRHEQVDPQVGAIVQRLQSSVGAELRV